MDSDRSSRGSERFRDSTYLIPSVSSDGKKPPRFSNWKMSWFVSLGTPLLMLFMGLGLEIATQISSKRGGFMVPRVNVFTLVSPQFLLSFIPSLLIIPAGYVWREIAYTVRWLQPYILLWHGRSPAEESILLDYVKLGPTASIFHGFKYRHQIVYWTSITAVTTFIFQPLAGAIFQLRQKDQGQWTSVTSLSEIGLAPDVDQLNAFVAAAGFAEAAVFHDLPDPPFVSGGWATGAFTFPSSIGMNGSLSVNTTGIQTSPFCANPVQTNLTQTAPNSFSLTSTSVEGCTVSVSYDPTLSAIQYGVLNVPCPGNAASANITFQPVMFWYFNNQDDGTPEVQTVFCSPSIKVFNITASAMAADRTLYDVSILNQYVPDNNVTGAPLNGQAFNGLIFPNNSNPFIQARAVATRAGVPGAIFRFASQQPGGPQSVFDLPNGFLDITSTVYTQHLSLVAQSIYFINANTTIPGEAFSFIPLLWIDPFPGHMLAILLVFVGIAGFITQIFHQRLRRRVLLTAPPGSIAAIVALTARSGFGELLLPYDDEATLERKLKGLYFRLDKRTGAIVADDEATERAFMGPNDAMLSLLGQSRLQSEYNAETPSSSQLAFQAASGYPPWKTPYDT